MTYVHQDDHKGDALGLLLSQYDDSTLVRALLATFIVGVQGLEDEAQRMLTERDLDTAVGVQLDTLGAIVGEKRKSRSDATYRAWVKARIAVNRSHGHADELLRILRGILGTAQPYVLKFTTLPPAAYMILVTGAPLGFSWDPSVTPTQAAGELASILEEATAAGVGLKILYQAAGDIDTFILADADAIQVSTSQGLADDAQTTGGRFVDFEVRGG